jgi:hypothetical protein
MHSCDTLLILGSTMPWEEYYPKPGQARGVQVDLKPDRLGLHYPVEIGPHYAGQYRGDSRDEASTRPTSILDRSRMSLIKGLVKK